MKARDIVVIGGSAGAIEVVLEVARGLGPDFPAAVFVVVHLPAAGPSRLASLISRLGNLPAAQASDREPIRSSRIYVATPDYHLVVDHGVIRLTRGPRENKNRPSIDVTFRSAAASHGPRVIGVLVSGNLDDGTAGMSAIKAAGGLTIVQDPDEAVHPSMPQSARDHVEVDYIETAANIASRLMQVVQSPISPKARGDKALGRESSVETRMAFTDTSLMNREQHPGQFSEFGCPECGGALWELHAGNYLRFRCRVGHAYAPDALMQAQQESVEAALWSALRGMQERAALARRLAVSATERGNQRAANGFEQQAIGHEAHIQTVRRLLLSDPASAHLSIEDSPNSEELTGSESVLASSEHPAVQR